MKRPEDDVHLTDGTGFMTEDARYQEHLKVAIEIKEVKGFAIGNINFTQNLHRKKLVMNTSLRMLQISICNIPCIPGLEPQHVSDMGVMYRVRLSISQKEKSESCHIQMITLNLQYSRQMNMDYCVHMALHYNMAGILRVILYYDIICQFWKYLRRRFRGNPHLHFPSGVEILRAIGLFHVHGHIDSCYSRYAPSFIEGAGQVDGEILETLWAVLNLIHSSIRRMSTAHRREVLDDHMNDSNWKKLIGMGKRIF